jgi:hypothetical protein
LKNFSRPVPFHDPVLIYDLLALSQAILAAEAFPNASVTAVDASAPALQVQIFMISLFSPCIVVASFLLLGSKLFIV